MHWFALAMIGNVLWSISDVLASMIMNRSDRSPVLIAWLHSFMQLIALGLVYLFLPVEHIWVGLFALGAMFTYVASLGFFKLLQTVDVSVSSVTWVFLSLGIALGSTILFGETWTFLQAFGAILSVLGALSLGLWHKSVSRITTCALLCISGFLFTPGFLIQKSAFLDGVSLLTVFFWSGFFYDVYASIFPLLVPSYRKKIRPFLLHLQLIDWSMIFLWMCVGLLGYLVTASAYKAGDASLVGITENGQPFFLMFFAWIAVRLAPKYAPKEIVTAQTTAVKIVTFIVVFIGLSLLAFS